MSAKSSSDFVHVEAPPAGGAETDKSPAVKEATAAAQPSGNGGTMGESTPSSSSTSAPAPQNTPIPPSNPVPGPPPELAAPTPPPGGRQGPPKPVKGVQLPRFHLKVLDLESPPCSRVLQLLLSFQSPKQWGADHPDGSVRFEVDEDGDDADGDGQDEDEEEDDDDDDDEEEVDPWSVNSGSTGLLTTCVRQVHAVLREGLEKAPLQPVRTLTLVVRLMDGVAYTKGAEDDDMHKEIHLSAPYIASQNPLMAQHELHGVLLHEMVHAYQWNAHDTAPGGLIEGIADYVRGRHGLAPRHWTEDPADTWDPGYEKTAYFLKYIAEHTLRTSNTRFVSSLNAHFRAHRWAGEKKPMALLEGRSTLDWWEQYVAEKKRGNSGGGGGGGGGAGMDEEKGPLASDEGLVEDEIELVMEQGDCSRQQAVQALRAHPQDLVAAIMSLVG